MVFFAVAAGVQGGQTAAQFRQFGAPALQADGISGSLFQ